MIEAVVQTGSFETAYRRAGCGGTVLLLVGDAGAAGDWLFEALAAHFRTYVPLTPGGLGGGSYNTFELWLRGLIDGLGLERPALVGGVADAAALLRFAMLDPDRVDRLALVAHGGNGAAGAAAVGAAAVVQPVLLLELPGPGEEPARAGALGHLLAFLSSPPQALTASRSVS